MIITRTPFRMSFFGGGTDVPSFFNSFGGAVLSTTFDKYCYVNVRRLPSFFDYSNEILYSQIERTASVEEIEHPLVRNALLEMRMQNIRISYEADLPARTGLGTSSSFAVGLLNALACLEGSYVPKTELAERAIRLERQVCNEAGGWQDQIAAAVGGFNRIDFADNSFTVSPIIIDPKRKKALADNLMLFFTGFTRFSSDIQREVRPHEKKSELLKMLELVDEAHGVLVDTERCLDDFGSLLGEAWQIKRGIGANVSSNAIDEYYGRAIGAGALGGKLLGAGGGGFLLFYVPQERQDDVRRSLADLMNVPFAFEESGTTVLHFTPER